MTYNQFCGVELVPFEVGWRFLPQNIFSSNILLCMEAAKNGGPTRSTFLEALKISKKNVTSGGFFGFPMPWNKRKVICRTVIFSKIVGLLTHCLPFILLLRSEAVLWTRFSIISLSLTWSVSQVIDLLYSLAYVNYTSLLWTVCPALLQFTPVSLFSNIYIYFMY